MTTAVAVFVSCYQTEKNDEIIDRKTASVFRVMQQSSSSTSSCVMTCSKRAIDAGRIEGTCNKTENRSSRVELLKAAFSLPVRTLSETQVQNIK